MTHPSGPPAVWPFIIQRLQGDRYTDSVNRQLGDFHTALDPAYGRIDIPARFAAVALTVALPPITEPGYIHTHPRVLSAEIHPSSRGDGAALAAVELVTERPASLTGLPGFDDLGKWREWPRNDFSSVHGFRYPDATDLTIAPHLTTMTRVEWKLPGFRLLDPRQGDNRVHMAAVSILDSVVAELNRVVGPVVTALGPLT